MNDRDHGDEQIMRIFTEETVQKMNETLRYTCNPLCDPIAVRGLEDIPVLPAVRPHSDRIVPTLAPVVVAYDDDPARYGLLASKCQALGWFFCCVEHPVALEQVLNRYGVLAVLLDHDLRDLRGEPINGLQVAQQCLVGRSVPVIISSANRVGANNIARALKEAQTPFRIMSVIDPDPEDRWMGVLLQILHTGGVE